MKVPGKNGRKSPHLIRKRLHNKVLLLTSQGRHRKQAALSGTALMMIPAETIRAVHQEKEMTEM